MTALSAVDVKHDMTWGWLWHGTWTCNSTHKLVLFITNGAIHYATILKLSRQAINNDMFDIINKCIGDDTKAAARQSLNCIKNKKNKISRKTFSIWRMEFLHPAMWHDHDVDFATWLHPAMWLWNRDSEFTKWQHPAMWYVALGWHATEFAQTSAILEFYI